MEPTPKDKDMFRAIGDLADDEEFDGVSVSERENDFSHLHSFFFATFFFVTHIISFVISTYVYRSSFQGVCAWSVVNLETPA
jgi:hypothetical protein